MTKGIACARCHDLRLFGQRDLEVTTCRCGNTSGWWLDGRKGIARYTAEAPYYAFGLGVNNRFFQQAFQQDETTSDEDWRRLHEESCVAPGYLFDKSRRNCWVLIFKPDKVVGVSWATDEERATVGLPPHPAGHALAFDNE